MRLLNLIFIIVCFSHSVPTATRQVIKNKFTIDSLTIKERRLKQYYQLATKSNSLKDFFEQKFFDEFPDSFEELNKIYGYSNHTPAPLYFEGEKHIIELFNNLSSINDTLYFKKIIKIALGGHWDADAVNYFQQGLRNRVESKTELAAYLLKSMNKKEISSFWYFYFDSVHPAGTISAPLQKIKFLNAELYKVMIEAHEKVIENVKEQ